MNKEIFTTSAGQTTNAVAPVQGLNRLVVDNAEKLVALQTFANLRALLDMSDAEAFQAHIGKHSELVRSFSEQFVGDAKAVAELGSDFGTEAQKLGKESVEAVTEKVA